MRPAGRLLAVIVAILALTACSERSGPVEVQTRELPQFNAIDMEGAAALQIVVGAPNSVQIEASAKVLDRIDTEVRDGTLYIRSRAKNWLTSRGGRHVSVRINLPELQVLRLGGGHRASIEGFAGGESQIKVEGAAQIQASGHLDTLKVHLAGAGTANLANLKSVNAHVTVDGVGRVVVHTSDSLDATMNGLGAIHYLGNPREVRTRMNGLGSIGKQDDAETEMHDEDVERSEKPRPEVDPEKLQPEYEDAKDWKKGGETEVI
jgi:hypothetical protein